jgi:hypothetical protein
MAAEGMRRKRNGWGDQNSVRVKCDGTVELEVPESWYQEQGWQPPVDQLPWADEAGEAKPPVEPAGASAASAPFSNWNLDNSQGGSRPL